MSIKASIKRYAPRWVISIYSDFCWNLIIRPRWRRMGMAAVFAEHYRESGWGSTESRSGQGSTFHSSQVVREALPQLIEELKIRSLLDIPCGDFNWMKFLDVPIVYMGADIVGEIVDNNLRNYGSPIRSFSKLDLTTDSLPRADLILCRDCLIHFSFRHIHRAVANIKRSEAKYLLTTTHPFLERNRDIVTGEWRRLNLEIAPFFFPKPLMLINEKCSDSYGHDKHLGLWRINEIPINRDYL
jgi:hypothetical protein